MCLFDHVWSHGDQIDTDRETDTDRHTERHRQTDRQTETEKQTYSSALWWEVPDVHY